MTSDRRSNGADRFSVRSCEEFDIVGVWMFDAFYRANRIFSQDSKGSGRIISFLINEFIHINESVL